MMQLRGYQQRMCREIGKQNGIVLLPTGAGKTLVAAEIVKVRLQRQEARAKKAVFFVPTCFLVEQQAHAIRHWVGDEFVVAEYNGNLPFPTQPFQILVSTPQAFRTLQRSRKWSRAGNSGTAQPRQELGWENFRLVVFDEVHHVLKDHPYRKLALSIRNHGSSSCVEEGVQADGERAKPQIVGLTALLTYAVTPEKIQKAQRQLCSELEISVIPHVPREELQRDGFHAGASVKTEVCDDADVPAEFEEHKVVPAPDRRPHLMHKTFWDRMEASSRNPGNPSCTWCAAKMVCIVRSLERHVAARLRELGPRCSESFASPLSKAKLSDWAAYANRLQKVDPDKALLHLFLESWYDALKIVVLTWEEPKGQELAILFLKMMTDKFGIDYASFARREMGDDDLASEIQSLFDTLDESPSLQHLTYQLLSKNLQRPNDLRAVVFVQQKITAHILAHHLNKDPDVCDAGLQSVPLHSTTTEPPTPSLKFTRADEKEHLELFSSGRKRVLVATSVAEEGMDIGAANCVIRYDPVHTGVSLVQGRGRARQEESVHVVAAQRPDRPVSQLQEVEEMQAAMSRSFAPAKGGKGDADAKERQAQQSRESNALKALEFDVPAKQAVQMLNVFCKRTKVLLEESFSEEQGLVLRYSSCLRSVEVRQPLAGQGSAQAREAKQLGAVELIRALLQSSATGSKVGKQLH